MDHRITKKTPLLNELGHLSDPGYAIKPLFEYNRELIKASKWRIKEWDYYACINKDFAVSFTVADLGYLGLVNASFLDFKTGKETKNGFMKFFTFGKFKMPRTCDEGNIIVRNKTCFFEFVVKDKERYLNVDIENFFGKEKFTARLKLIDNKEDRMVIATPWLENKKAFYYNQKINCMPTSGMVSIGDKSFSFNEEECFSVLDWGRGVWTYINTWYWSSLSGVVDGKRIGFNLGYGFGDTSKASENMIFYEGKAHKLDKVEFILDSNDVMKPWKFKSNEGRLELEMTPLLDRVDNTNLLIIKNYGHQVFGKFNGYVVLDDGTKIEIKDVIGFAEEIYNRY
jgi:hypothetical protein